MEDLVVKLVETEEERRAAFEIRLKVFVQEQGVPVDEEMDDYDATATHVIASLGKKAVGTGRVVYQETGEARIGRMAVEESRRRRGIGGRMLSTLEQAAKERGMAEAVLNAQTYAKHFYAAHGYVEDGDVLLEVGIEHVQMRKRL